MRAQVPAAREMELPFEPYNTDLIEAEGFDPIVMMPRLAEEEEVSLPIMVHLCTCWRGVSRPSVFRSVQGSTDWERISACLAG